MRRLKIIIGVLLITLLLNVIIFFTITVTGYDIVYNIFKNHTIEPIDIYDNEYSEFSHFEKEIKRSTVFYVEEYQGVKVNYDIYYNNIMYYADSYNLKYIVMDLSYTEGLWINHYLLNENDIDSVYNMVVGYDFSIEISNEFYNLIVKIYEYNNQNEKNKIGIIGINAEKSDVFTIEYIDYLFDLYATKRKPTEISNVYNFSGRNELDYYQNMYNSLISNERIYKEYFVDRYYSLYMVLRNYINSQDNVDNTQICVDNFVDIYNYNIHAKYYIQLPQDLSFYSQLITNHPDFENETFYTKLYYDNCTSKDNDKFYQYPYNLNESGESQIYILNNSVLNYFEKHRRFVYKINKREYESYDTEQGEKYIILANSPAITLLEVQDDSD